ncbi:non-hydrolyzing UDP-N-acetylglucosamine 2-epimerase [Puia sp. P3]|uniref:non-hydrolyzing UDP-N-acetylglucosamine 2-epimerase n=1 Tax=Puia sp. P3 TaxID=3423952 RepID=UPI003D6670AA
MIVTVIGARPQFVKAAIVSRALQKVGLQESLIHTGQHYDEKMSDVFWRELGLPECSVNLESGSGTHGAQTAYMIERIEAFLMSQTPAPKALLLYGDTNSTIAGAIAASKLQIPIIHIEAGLRSFNRSMPEEINRIVTDHLSSLLFCSSDEGVRQLAAEGITERVYISGDVMFDALQTFTGEAEKKVSLDSLLPFKERPFCLLTLHRPANTEKRENLSAIFDSLRATGMPVLWPIHPRMRSKLSQIELPANVHVTDPLSYFEMLTALKHCYKVFTDSGGLQKEAYWMKRPCITLRTETEWVETVHDDWNTVTGADAEKIQAAFKKSVSEKSWYPLYGSGDASDLIARQIKDYLK